MALKAHGCPFVSPLTSHAKGRGAPSMAGIAVSIHEWMESKGRPLRTFRVPTKANVTSDDLSRQTDDEAAHRLAALLRVPLQMHTIALDEFELWDLVDASIAAVAEGGSPEGDGPLR